MFKIFQNQYFSLAAAVSLFLLIISQPACGAFTIEDEKKLGKDIYTKLDQDNFILHDQKLNAYITDVGNRILAGSDKAPFDYTFSIFNNTGINAFATPGGYIYINKGLISAVENEAQLAGVMAHEIAHANARHIASIIEKSKKLNIAMLAGLVAAALIGGGGETSAAIAAFSLAGATQMSLKYQREHEEEADRMGITYLVDAGYYPAAMVEFLKIIKQYEFFSKTIPSYLSTHPGTDDRIFYLDSLLATQYRNTGGAKNIVGNFLRIQALVARDADDLRKHHRQLTQDLAKDPRNVDLLYALALSEDQLGHMAVALELLKKALALAPRDADILKSIGLVSLKTGDATTAITHLLEATVLYPDDEQIILALGKAYFTAGEYQKSLNYYQLLESRLPDDPQVLYQIAMCQGKLNRPGESHYYFGLYFKKENKRDSALFHLRKAIPYYQDGSSRAIAIAAAINELTTEKPDKNQKPQTEEKND
jgi:predicted Zn-dependent protease